MMAGQQPTKQTNNTQTRKETNKQASNHNSRTPRTPPRELVESSAVWKTVWKSLGIASGGGLWPEDDGEINNLTNNIGLWPQGEDDVPDVPSPADALHNSEGGMLVPYDAK